MTLVLISKRLAMKVVFLLPLAGAEFATEGVHQFDEFTPHGGFADNRRHAR
jgi:hypothetical protein